MNTSRLTDIIERYREAQMRKRLNELVAQTRISEANRNFIRNRAAQLSEDRKTRFLAAAGEG